MEANSCNKSKHVGNFIKFVLLYLIVYQLVIMCVIIISTYVHVMDNFKFFNICVFNKLVSWPPY
jgi:hypothetical protein